MHCKINKKFLLFMSLGLLSCGTERYATTIHMELDQRYSIQKKGTVVQIEGTFSEEKIAGTESVVSNETDPDPKRQEWTISGEKFLTVHLTSNKSCNISFVGPVGFTFDVIQRDDEICYVIYSDKVQGPILVLGWVDDQLRPVRILNDGQSP